MHSHTFWLASFSLLLLVELAMVASSGLKWWLLGLIVLAVLQIGANAYWLGRGRCGRD